MAQPTQYHPPPYASPHSTPSPMTPGASPAFAPPPTKRPQMSPTTPTGGFHQPAHSQSIPNGNNATYNHNPYAQQNQNPYPLPPQTQHAQPPMRHTPPPHPSLSFQQPPQQPAQAPPAQAQGTMGPPQKPDENKNPDLNDIADVMHGSGVNLREEEANLAQHGRRSTSYAYAGQPGVFDPQRNTLQANIPGGRDSFYGSGNFNQPAVTLQDAQETAEAKERLQKRRRAERVQFHNNEPFLQQNTVLNKINMAAQKNQIQIDMNGVYRPQPNTTNTLAIQGPEGSERIVTLTKEHLLNMTTPMGDLLTLISLAARERVRTAVEDSSALARLRRTTSHGIVPPDFQDIAIGEGKTQEATAEPTPIIGAGSASASSRKRSHSQANDLPTPVSDVDASDKPSPQPTISFEDKLAKEFQRRAEEEERWEQERLAKRARRDTAKLISSGTGEAASASGTPAPGTPGGPGAGIAPEPSKLTKKEQKKKQEAAAASSAASNMSQSLGLALGGKQYNWMKPAGGAGKTSTPALPKKADKSAAATAAAKKGAPAAKGAKNLGGFREDRVDGKGIQIRDLVNALKEHNPEKFTLSKAFNRLEPRL